MSLNLLFWLIYLIAAVVSVALPVYNGAHVAVALPFLVLWILVGILGWKNFGPAIKP